MKKNTFKLFILTNFFSENKATNKEVFDYLASAFLSYFISMELNEEAISELFELMKKAYSEHIK